VSLQPRSETPTNQFSAKAVRFTCGNAWPLPCCTGGSVGDLALQTPGTRLPNLDDQTATERRFAAGISMMDCDFRAGPLTSTATNCDSATFDFRTGLPPAHRHGISTNRNSAAFRLSSRPPTGTSTDCDCATLIFRASQAFRRTATLDFEPIFPQHGVARLRAR
jgi:hypothetical protein